MTRIGCGDWDSESVRFAEPCESETALAGGKAQGWLERRGAAGTGRPMRKARPGPALSASVAWTAAPSRRPAAAARSRNFRVRWGGSDRVPRRLAGPSLRPPGRLWANGRRLPACFAARACGRGPLAARARAAHGQDAVTPGRDLVPGRAGLDPEPAARGPGQAAVATGASAAPPPRRWPAVELPERSLPLRADRRAGPGRRSQATEAGGSWAVACMIRCRSGPANRAELRLGYGPAPTTDARFSFQATAYFSAEITTGEPSRASASPRTCESQRGPDRQGGSRRCADDKGRRTPAAAQVLWPHLGALEAAGEPGLAGARGRGGRGAQVCAPRAPLPTLQGSRPPHLGALQCRHLWHHNAELAPAAVSDISRRRHGLRTAAMPRRQDRTWTCRRRVGTSSIP